MNHQSRCFANLWSFGSSFLQPILRTESSNPWRCSSLGNLWGAETSTVWYLAKRQLGLSSPFSIILTLFIERMMRKHWILRIYAIFEEPHFAGREANAFHKVFRHFQLIWRWTSSQHDVWPCAKQWQPQVLPTSHGVDRQRWEPGRISSGSWEFTFAPQDFWGSKWFQHIPTGYTTENSLEIFVR